MRRYLLAALGLKVASTNNLTRRAYRAVGNRTRSRRSRELPDIQLYVRDGERFAEICTKYDVLHQHDKVLELGTGWSHAHALFMRLRFDAEISMFDIADIRNLDGCLAHLSALSKHLEADQKSGVTAATLDKAVKSRDFGEL